MSALVSTPHCFPDIPVPTITLNPAPRNERDAIDFQEFLLLSPHKERFPMIQDVKVKVKGDDHLRTPPPQVFLPLTPAGDDGSLPFLPSLNTPPPVRDGTIHLEARGAHTWAGRHTNAPVSASPRDVVAESEAAYIHGTTGSSFEHKKGGVYEESDHGDLRRAWPLDDERDPSCTRYVEDATSDCSSLSSSPWEFQGDTDNIFRMRSKLGSPNRPSEWSRSPVRYDADSQKALQLWIRSAPPLCVSTSDCSSTSTCCENVAMSKAPTKHDHYNHYIHDQEYEKSYDKAADMEKSTTGRGRRLREALELLIDVFTPECCAPHMRVNNRPGVLKPWHILVPSPPTPQRELSSTRLRGCYL